MTETRATMKPLAGSSGIVTGAGGGVGRGIALALAKAGANVALAVRRRETGESVAEEIEAAGGAALVTRCDVTLRSDAEASVAATRERFGAVDFAIHNATSRRSPEVCRVEDAAAELWEEHASVSLRGSYHCARAAFAELRRRRGHFILLTSPAGIEGSKTLPLYATVKGAQRAFAKSLAQEWGPHGIRVNAISPLAITPALERAYQENPELEARLRALVPLGRVGDPERDIGAAVVALLGDAGRYVSGQTWVVDGGRFTGL